MCHFRKYGRINKMAAASSQTVLQKAVYDKKQETSWYLLPYIVTVAEGESRERGGGMGGGIDGRERVWEVGRGEG
jgi:hypothetical protein